MKSTTCAALASAFIISISAGCVIHAQEAGYSHQTPRPSLGDTEAWIAQTFTDENTGRSDCNEFNYDGLGNVSEDPGPYMDCFSTSYDNLTIDQCGVTFEIHKLHSVVDKNGMHHEVMDTLGETVTFDLGDIDPTSILGGSPYGRFGNSGKKTYHDNPPSYVDISVRTTNDSNRISVEYGLPRQPISKRHTPEMRHTCCGLIENGITVAPGYAPRFIKALRNAVELCGGKSSTF
ncbi:MAG: hypothetical protein WCF17_17740 [Terracidiphilus sp.]